MNPVISVMVVTYNQEEYIAKTLDSILEQECSFPFEIVIGEDCSTDNTRAICESYASLYPDIIRLIKNETNKGVLKNYVDTLLSCRGEFIADLAGDDYWIDKKKLERQANFLLSKDNCVACFTNYQKLFEENGQLSSPVNTSGEPYSLSASDIPKHMGCMGDPLIFTCTAMFRKSAFESFYNSYPSFFEDDKYTCEDFQLVFALLYQGEVLYDPAVTTVYRIGKSSVTNNRSLTRKKDFAIGLIHLRLDLINQFHLPVATASSFFDYRLKEIYSLSIKLNNTKGLDPIRRKLEAEGYSPDLTIRAYSLISKNKILSMLFQIFKK